MYLNKEKFMHWKNKNFNIYFNTFKTNVNHFIFLLERKALYF